MRIQVLYFSGCPNHGPAVQLVRQVAADLGLDPDIEQVELTSGDDAAGRRFLGSPTILVEGVDVEPEARPRTDYGFSCRTYDGRGLPSQEVVAAALLEAARGTDGLRAGPDCWAPVVPAALAGNGGSHRRAGLWAAGGSAISGIASSACCWFPLLLLALGVSAGGVSAWFEKYRILFLAVTVLLLGAGFYLVYFRNPACAPGSECAAPGPKFRRFSRTILWVATAVVITSAAFPNYIGYLLADTAPAEAADALGELTTMELRIGGMKCEGCAALVEKALRKVPGVRRASVFFREGRAEITIDTAMLADDEPLAEVVEALGFEVVRNAGPADS